MNSAAFNKIAILFRNAHYIAKSNRPYSDYVTLCNLDKAKGLDIGDTYITDKSCQKFVNAIAVTRQKEQDAILNLIISDIKLIQKINRFLCLQIAQIAGNGI